MSDITPPVFGQALVLTLDRETRASNLADALLIAEWGRRHR